LPGRAGSSFRIETTALEGESMKTPADLCNKTSIFSNFSGNISLIREMGILNSVSPGEMVKFLLNDKKSSSAENKS